MEGGGEDNQGENGSMRYDDRKKTVEKAGEDNR